MALPPYPVRAIAQVGPNGAAPVPGTGDSTKISSGNRESQANYNHLLNAGDPKPSDTSTEAKPRRAGKAVPATAADIKAGSSIRDSAGVRIGSVDTVEADGAVVSTGATKVKVPLVAFGKDDQGLLLGITAARFNELIAKAHGSN
jgi:hypothetical protein